MSTSTPFKVAEVSSLNQLGQPMTSNTSATTQQVSTGATEQSANKLKPKPNPTKDNTFKFLESIVSTSKVSAVKATAMFAKKRCELIRLMKKRKDIQRKMTKLAKDLRMLDAEIESTKDVEELKKAMEEGSDGEDE